jgi:hypothetical protein
MNMFNRGCWIVAEVGSRHLELDATRFEAQPAGPTYADGLGWIGSVTLSSDRMATIIEASDDPIFLTRHLDMPQGYHVAYRYGPIIWSQPMRGKIHWLAPERTCIKS